MRTLFVLAGLCAAGVALSAQSAQRTYTNPKPEEHFKKVFPNGVAFSPLAGEPLHIKVFGVDPKSNPAARPIGYVFWTTDIVPREQAYHGPIHVLVGMDTAGILTGAVVDYHAEPYGYFSVQPQAFAEQFRGKSIRDPFRVGEDIDAVSRATISVTSGARAVRDSARAMARQFLSPDAVKK
jgi:electron transport complex protein RnfG